MRKIIEIRMLALLILLPFTYANAAENTVFNIEHILIGDSLKRIKEKKIGWDYNGLQVDNKGGLHASFSKKLSNVPLQNEWCLCSWKKVLAVHLDKEDKVEGLTLIISNTINQKEVLEMCSPEDWEKCKDSSVSINSKEIYSYIDNFGVPDNMETIDGFLKQTWKNEKYTMTITNLIFKTIIRLEDSERLERNQKK